MLNPSKDDLFVHSSYNRLDRCASVVATYQGNFFEMSPAEARERAMAILTAAAIAESEAAVIKALTPPVKGFKPSPYSKEFQMKAAVLEKLRANRPELPRGVSALFGAHTQKALLQLEWYGKVQVTPDTARHHALCLLEVAEATESDLFWHTKFAALGWQPEEIDAVMREFFEFRNQPGVLL